MDEALATSGDRREAAVLDGEKELPARALRDLSLTLETAGLAAFLAAFPPHSTRADRWRREAENLDAPLRALVHLLVLGQAVSAGSVPRNVVQGLAPLFNLGLAEEAGSGRLRMSGVVLGRPLGVWLLAEPAGLAVDHYFGPDSIALAQHATCRAGSTCLDLCAGPGFQALVALGRCRSAVLVELQPNTARLATINLALNGLESRARVLCGDLFTPVANERFDHVLANIPFVPVPDGYRFPVAGAGGADGFAVGRRVLNELWKHLAPSGSAHLAALFLRGNDGLLLAGELDTWTLEHDCSIHITLTASLPLSPDADLVRATAAAIAATLGSEAGCSTDLAAEVATHYRRLGADRASWAFLRVDRSSRGLRILDLGGKSRLGPWVSMI